MADTERTKTQLLAIFADGQPEGSIDPQDMRDYVVTTDVVNTRFSTGLITGGIVTADSSNTVKISAGEGFYADNFTDPQNPVRLKVSWSDFNGVTLPDIGTQPTTFFGLDLSSGVAVVVKKAQLFTAAERRDFISLAPAVHTNGVSIESIGAVYSYALDERQALTDLAFAVGGINLDNGNVYSPNAAADLTMDKSAGGIFFIGDNYQNSQKTPNATVDPVQTPVLAIFYTYQDGLGGFINVPAIPAEIDPFLWDDGSGTLQEVPNSLKFSIQRIWSLPLLNITFIHYAQATYGTMAAAQAAINTEAFNKNPGLVSQFRAWLIVEKGTTDLTLPAGTLFVTAGRFGDVLRD